MTTPIDAQAAAIDAELSAALDVLDQKLDEANTLKNNGAAGMAAVISRLEAERADLKATAYQGALESAAMARALAALTAAAKDMSAVAARMKSATSFVSNLDAFVSAAGKVAACVQGAKA